MCEFYLRRRLSVSGGLGDLDVLHLNRVLAVAVRVLQLADIHCLVLRVWRGSLCKQKNVLLADTFSITHTKRIQALLYFSLLTQMIENQSLWALPEPPAPLAAGCVEAETRCLLLPERRGCTGSSGSLPAACGSRWSASERAPSSPESADLWSVKSANPQSI